MSCLNIHAKCIALFETKGFYIIVEEFLRAFEDHPDGRIVFTLETSSRKYGCGVVDFRLNLPCCGTHFICEELEMQI